MYLGNIVELAESQEMFDHPTHPYTEALLSAIPTTDVEDVYKRQDYNRDYVLDWDPVVVKDHEVIENDDGSKTYRFEINDNLKWSDGSPITAKDYVFSLLLHSSPEFAACEGDCLLYTSRCV